MALSAHLSPNELYVAFMCTYLKNGCDPTENVPSWFDRVWYFVWYSANASVSLDYPISFTFDPDLHIKIPTNLGPGSASKIGNP